MDSSPRKGLLAPGRHQQLGQLTPVVPRLAPVSKQLGQVGDSSGKTAISTPCRTQLALVFYPLGDRSPNRGKSASTVSNLVSADNQAAGMVSRAIHRSWRQPVAIHPAAGPCPYRRRWSLRRLAVRVAACRLQHRSIGKPAVDAARGPGADG